MEPTKPELAAPSEAIQVETGAEALLRLLDTRQGVKFLFTNFGTDYAPFIESHAKLTQKGEVKLRVILVPHETPAISMAHGHYLLSGKTQVVMVHTLPGTFNILGNLWSAFYSRIPMVIIAGRTPITEAGLVGGKTSFIHWTQESRDQAGPIRDFVKCDWEHRLNHQLEDVISRAFRIAESYPRGPVYISFPRELWAEPFKQVQVRPEDRYKPTPPHGPDPSLLDAVVEALLHAENPLVITKYLGRNQESPSLLVEMAELLAIPVVQTPLYMNFPTDHPLHLGLEPGERLRSSDLIFIIDHDVPWVPSIARPSASARIIYLDIDPVQSRIPTWGFPADLTISSDSGLALRMLNERLSRALSRRSEVSARIRERFAKLKAEHETLKSKWKEEALSKRDSKPIEFAWLSYCIGKIKDEDTIIFSEYDFLPQYADFNKPGTIFQSPSTGHLGWAFGAGLGAKLAAPERTVIVAVGDGSYIFNVPIACHFVANANKIPVLVVIFNNRRWGSTQMAAKFMYPNGWASRTGDFVGTKLEPTPKYELVAKSCSAYAETVDDPTELESALKNALQATREGRQALLDVICS